MENFHFSTPHVQNLFQEQDARYRWVVSLSSQVQLTRGGATETGVLLVDMSFGGIEHFTAMCCGKSGNVPELP